jgi:hypothetical protein
LGGLDAAHVWHGDIQNDDIGFGCLRPFHCLAAICGFTDHLESRLPLQE